jgi:pimeloyl-ACP methyl ester carboxylesterase
MCSSKSSNSPVGRQAYPSVKFLFQRRRVNVQTVNHRGYEIAYDVTGDGPAVVLQHGLLSNRTTWHQIGYVESLADAFRVICVDSLGHGASDKPHDPAAYGRDQRAGDIAAVLDAEGIGQAHYIGYSMGGWIGSGMAVYQPQRLLSLTIGGWDPVGGAAMDSPGPIGIDEFLQLAKKAAPQLVEWVTDATKPGLAACWEALADTQGSAEALQDLGVPILLWAGEQDACYAPAKQLARSEGFDFHGVPGDHVGARMQYVSESASGLRRFLDRHI